MVRVVLDEVKDLIENSEAVDKAEQLEYLEKYGDYVNEWKKHEMRHRKQEEIRHFLLDYLNEQPVFID